MSDGLDPAGVATFCAVIFGIAALSCGKPEHWGFRRVALGACACASATTALLLGSSGWWWSGILWGLHQMYLGWSYVNRRRRISHERLEYLQSSASVLTFVALADNDVTPRELDIIRRTYARAGFSGGDLNEVQRVVEECKRRFFADGSDPDRLFKLLLSACTAVLPHTNEHTRLSLFGTAILIAVSDGFVSASEDNVLRALTTWLGISEVDGQREWRRAAGQEPADAESGGSESARGAGPDRGQESHGAPVVPPDLATYYASILGVPLTVSPQDLKRAYRDKAKQYHPDVVTHRGAAAAQEAEERFKELSKAYEFLRGTTMVT